MILEKLHISESLNRLGGVERLVRQIVGADPESHAASLLDKPGDPEARIHHFRKNKMKGAESVRSVAVREISKVRHLVFHNFAGLSMLSGSIQHERATVFLHTNSDDVFGLLSGNLSHIDAVIASGEQLSRELKDRFPNIKIPIVGLDYPLDGRFFTEEAKVSKGTIVIGFAGRLEFEQKKIMRLVEFCKALTDLNFEFEFEIAGSGGAEQKLRKELDSPFVRFLGELDVDELSAAYRRWDFIVCTSDYETGPLVVMEAMASQVVPIMPEIPCQATNLLKSADIPRYSKGDMKDAARLLVEFSNDSKLVKLRSEIREVVSNRKVERFVQQIDETLDKVANDSRHGAPARSPGGLQELLPFYLRRGGDFLR